jgi:hypothetical protein
MAPEIERLSFFRDADFDAVIATTRKPFRWVLI